MKSGHNHNESTNQKEDKMTAKILSAPQELTRTPATVQVTLLDRVLDSVACCASTENSKRNLTIDQPQCGISLQPLGESILPHLRFRPLPPSSEDSSLQDFFKLFLANDAPHSFLIFHRRNGDENVRVGPWRDVEGGEVGYHRSATLPSETEAKLQLLASGKRMQRTISFVTKITPSNDAMNTTIPIAITNTQTLSMEDSICVLESKIQFDFDNGSSRALAGLSQFLVSNDVRGSEVIVRVVLSEGDGTNVMGGRGDALMGKERVIQRPGSPGNEIILESPEQKPEDQNISFFSCFSHPLLLPPDSLCGPISKAPSVPKEQSFKRTNSYVDIHGEKHQELLQEDDKNHAHVGASLLSAIKAKNENEKPSKKTWTSDKVFGTNRFDEIERAAAAVRASDPEYQDDVLACTSRGNLKLKPIPSFEFVKAPSTSNSEGHMAMRRMILDKDGAMTSSLSHKFKRSASTTSLTSTGSITWRGLAMRIEMEIHPPNAALTGTSSLSSFSRSKGSFTNIDIKVRKGLKKRVSRTWISWAESWCMRMWEEEESNRIKAKAANKVDGVSRKRKTNVRPQVRRIGEKRESEKPLLSRWNDMDLNTNESTQWMFVRQSSKTLEEEVECGVEVACALPKVQRKIPNANEVSPINEGVEDDEPMVHKTPSKGREKVKKGRKSNPMRRQASETGSTGSRRWSKSAQVKSKCCSANKR